MGAADLTTVSAWLGVIAFTLQIYFDFSGYSDMATGLGSMFGFLFLKTLSIRMNRKVLPSFGADGTFLLVHGLRNMFISR